jgi:hypothetical protein
MIPTTPPKPNKANGHQQERNSHVHPVLQDTINSFSTIFGRDGKEFMDDIKSITDDYASNHPEKIKKP